MHLEYDIEVVENNVTHSYNRQEIFKDNKYDYGYNGHRGPSHAIQFMEIIKNISHFHVSFSQK